MKIRKLLGLTLSLLMLINLFVGLGVLPSLASDELTATALSMTASNVFTAANGITNLMTTRSQLGVSGGNLQSACDKYFDGLVPGVNTTDANWGGWSGLSANTDYYHWYDFGEPVALNAIELGGINGNSGFPTYTLPAFSLYATNDLEALKAGKVTPVTSVTAEETAENKGFIAVLDRTVEVQYVAVKIRSYSHVGKNQECWISEFGAALLPDAMVSAFLAGGALTGDSFDTICVPVTDKGQLPEGSLIAGLNPTRSDGATPNTGNNTKLSNLTDGGVQGLDQTVAYRLTENPMSKNGKYYNWIAPAELVELLGYDASKTWYIQDENNQWWGSNVSSTAGTLYKDDAKLVYDLGGTTQINQIFIASSTEIGDGATNNNTAGPNQACPWSTVQQQMAVTHPERYALVCHVYVGDTRNVFTEGREVMSFDWQEKANNAKALRNLFTLGEAAEGRYVGFDFTDGDAVSGFIRLSELAVYGAQPLRITDIDANNVSTIAIQPEENLLKNATMGGTATDNTGKLYDGITSLTDSSAYLWCPSGGTSRELWFQWDLGQAYAVSSFMLIGSGNTGWGSAGGCGVYGMDVFVGDKTLAELKAETNAQPDYTTTDTIANGRRIDFPTALNGQYIVVRVGGYPRSGGNEGQIWISEVGATGTPLQTTVGYDVNTDNADQAIAAADNALAKRVSVQWAADTAGAAVKTPDLKKDLFDGKICGVNAANEYSDPIGDAQSMLLTVDMGRSYTFDSFMLAGSGINSYGVEGFSLFINDTPLTAMAGAADRQALYTHDGNVTNGYRVDFATPQSGRYVHILCTLKSNGGNWQMWISELAATGKADKLEKKIITVGDSITEGIHFPNLDNWSTATFENRYSDVVTAKLNQNDSEYAYVLYNAGISGSATVGKDRVGNGDTVEGWINHTRKTDKIQYCDILTIMLGTNDAPTWSARKSLYKECYTDIVNAYRAINPDLQLYVLTSPYTPNGSYSALEQEVVPLQKQLAQELGGTVIDVYTYTKLYTLTHTEADFIDEIDTAKGLRVHPGENGHKVIADIVYAGITKTAIPDYITAHTHSYTETVTKPATCMEIGEKTLTCSLCGETKTESIPATGEHRWDEGTVTKPATCTEDGEKTVTCATCGGVKKEVINALGHDWAEEWTIDTPATTTTVGSKSHHCTRCDAKTDVTEIPMLPTGFTIDLDTGLFYYYTAKGQLYTAERLKLDGKWYNFYPANSVVGGVDVSYSLLSGWAIMPDGTTRYYPDGAYWYATGCTTIDGETYFFQKGGVLYAPAETEYGMGWYTYHSKTGDVYYALNPETHAWVHGLYTDKNGDTYYFPKYAKAKGYATGFVTVDGKQLYFGADGKQVTDETLIPKNGWYTDPATDKTYYYKNGVKNTKARLKVDGVWYNFDAEGVRLLGWVTADGVTRYYAEGAYWYATGCTTIDGKTYFFQKGGALYAPTETEYGMGWYVYHSKNGDVYYALDPETHAWVYGLYTDKNGDTYYFPKYAKTKGYFVGTVTIKGESYTFGEDGKLVSSQAD